MILSQISYLDCVAFLVFLAPQLLIQIGIIPLLTWLIPALPSLAITIPYQFIRERFIVPHENRAPFVRKATPFQDLVIRFVRYAFANMPAFLGRVFFSKAVSLPFLRFRMLRHGIVTSPIRWTEIKRPNFAGVWIVHDRQEQPDVIVYYCHGGGFSMGSSFFYMEFLLAWVALLKSAGYRNPALFALEYTLVPDATYPTQLHETVAGYEYVLSLAQSSTRVVVGGDSAGATLILSFLLHLSNHTELRHQKPGLAVMISPWVTIVSRENRNTASDYLNSSSLELYGRQYIGSKVSPEDPMVSPGKCKDVNKWTEASPEQGWYFLFGSSEVLGPETRDLISLLGKTGKEVDSWEEPGGIHAWPVASLYLGETREEPSFTSASSTTTPFSSYSSTSQSLRFLRYKPNAKPLNYKFSRSFSVRASATGADDSVVTVLDYGAGNVRSLRNAIKHLGFDIKDVQTPEDILKAKRLIFPGVGAFAPAMDVLNKKGMAEALCAYVEQDRPFLGICLGLQLLFESSEENGPVKGLGLIPGVVGRFDSSKGIRVPHIGWNALKIAKDTQILDDVGNSHVYFVHSYRAMPSDENREWISSTCKYGDDFIASIQRGNVHAVQFHPEKSGDVGLSILRRFLNPKSGRTQKLVQGNASKLAKRVIACLDVRTNDKGDLVVTKGDQYDVRESTKENEVRNLGKPVDLAGQYYKDGADEVSFLNITAFRDFPLGDLPMLQVLRYASENVFVPLTVGGGIRDFKDANGRYYSSLEVASEYFRSGADKISIGSDAVYAAEEYLKSGVKTGKSSLEQISRVYGNQAVVVSIDPRRVYVKDPKAVEFRTVKVRNPGPNGEEYAWYQCTVSGGREGRLIGAYELAKAVEELGAGEILLNCIDCDGQGKGFDIDLIKLISDAVSIPVIASSGAGAVEHFTEVFRETNASAALAAGIFHRKEIPIQAVKEHLSEEGIEVRM